jgi:hypothetical protein
MKTVRFLGRPAVLFYTMPWLMVITVWGTIAQKNMGLFAATERYFSSFFFDFYGFFLPAGYTILGIMTVNLVCHLVFYSPWKLSKIGVHISHLSIIVLMVGGLMTAITTKEGFMVLNIGDTKSAMMAFREGEMFITPDMADSGNDTANLPFSMTLDNFRREVYAGSNIPKLYESHVTIIDGDLNWPSVIGMNDPLRYGGYTFYQASTFVNNRGQAVSVLNVVKNDGWLFPYIAGIMMAFGLALHVFIRQPRKNET